MKERKHKYFDNPDWNVAFERCIDVLAELIEKYSDKVLNPAAIDINYNSIAITDYPIFLDGKIIICEKKYVLSAENLKAYSKLSGIRAGLKKTA
ncbi:MAG: hypothetical protein E7232_01090 [Lachnospiraceae bacterium]|nr:hypothetical protein [Lachnospiraceae bacterium]MBE6002674.1 hypothetical protein [Lachnospiraceae bacterium]